MPFLKAEKNHAIGEGLINSLFKNKMLDLQAIPELQELMLEFNKLSKGTPKHRCRDDLIDSLRYAISKLPVNFSKVDNTKIITFKNTGRQTNKQREVKYDEGNIDRELSDWDELMGECLY